MWPSHALMSFLSEIQNVEDEGPVIVIILKWIILTNWGCSCV